MAVRIVKRLGGMTTLRALVLDHDDRVEKELGAALAPLEVVVDCPRGQAHAARLASQYPYGLILLSLEEADAGGFGLLDRLRARQPHAVVVACAGEELDPTGLLEAINEHGVHHVLSRPFDAAPVARLLKRVAAAQLERAAEAERNRLLARADDHVVEHRRLVDRAVLWVREQDGGSASVELADIKAQVVRNTRELFALLGEIDQHRLAQAALADVLHQAPDEPEAVEASAETPAVLVHERRAHERVPLVADVKVRTADGDERIGASEDLSFGGLFVAVDPPSPRGTVVEVEILLPGASAPVCSRAEVAWVRPANGAAGAHARRAGMGLRFDELGEDAQAAIAGFIDGWTEEGLAQLDVLCG